MSSRFVSYTAGPPPTTTNERVLKTDTVMILVAYHQYYSNTNTNRKVKSDFVIQIICQVKIPFKVPTWLPFMNHTLYQPQIIEAVKKSKYHYDFFFHV